MKAIGRTGTGRAALLAGLALAGACGGGADGSASAAFTVADSAGVRVVVNRVPETGFPTHATPTPEPLRVVGAGEGLAQVVGVAALEGGGVAVGDGAGGRVLFFPAGGGAATVVDVDGQVSRIGRVAGDTVWVADHRGGRVLRVTPTGVAGEDAFPPGLLVAGRFADDAYLLVPQWSAAAAGEDGLQPGVRRDRAAWARWSPGGLAAERVGDFPHDEVMVISGPSGLAAGVPPFGRRTSRVVGSDAFWSGDQTTFELRRHAPDGTLTTIVRLEGVDLTLTDAVKDAVRPAPSSDTTAGPSLVDLLWEGVPATRPAYTRLLLDEAERLWVAEHVAGDAPARNWLVFSGDGVAEGMVTFPAGFVPFEIDGEGVWGWDEASARVVRHGWVR